MGEYYMSIEIDQNSQNALRAAKEQSKKQSHGHQEAWCYYYYMQQVYKALQKQPPKYRSFLFKPYGKNKESTAKDLTFSLFFFFFWWEICKRKE